MKKPKIIFAVILISLISSIIYFNTKEDSKSKVKKTIDRIYNINLSSVSDSIRHEFNSTDYFLANNNIFLKNYSTQEIIQTDFKLNELKRFGRKGEGPKETIMIRGYDIEGNSYRTIDAGKNSISKITFNDSLVYTYKPTTIINTGVFIANENLIIKGSKGDFGEEKIKFTIVNQNSEKEIKSTQIFPDKKNSHWIYDGFFKKLPNDEALYVTHFTNKFIRFNNLGEIVYKKEFIYEVPEIKLHEDNGILYPIENDAPNVYSAASNDKYVFFLTSIGDKKNKKGEMIVDGYLIENGDYYGSFGIKEDKEEGYPNDIRVFDNNLFLFYDTIVKRFKLNFN